MIKKLKIVFSAILILGICLPSHSFANQSPAQVIAKDFTAVAKKAIPAVVSITVKVSGQEQSEDLELFENDFFQQFFSLPNRGKARDRQAIGHASGFIVKPNGYILTNSHVVANASEISVSLQDGRVFKATLVGKDPKTDVGLIKIDATDLPYLELGNSDDIEIGEWAIAIGNPFELQATLTVGVISAKGRHNLDIENIEEQDFIQTDTAINRGNSGGPLLDLDGQVIGINTAIATNVMSGYMGIGFAVPSNIVKSVMEQLITSGKVTRGFIGVRLQSIDQNLAQSFGLKKIAGALVAEVIKGSPAEKAGIKQGDVILAYNGKEIANSPALSRAISMMPSGSKVTLTILRKNEQKEISVEVGTNSSKEGQHQASSNKLGFEVQDLTSEIASALGVSEGEGVVITKVLPNSAAEWAGLRKGALIMAANQEKVNSVEEFNAILDRTPADKPVLLLIRQGNSVRFLSLRSH